MKNIIQKSIILLATISLCSCSDFLKESSQDEVIPSTIEDWINYWHTKDIPDEISP